MLPIVTKNSIIIVGAVLIIGIASFFLFGSGIGGDAINIEKRAERVEDNIKTAGQHNDAASAELLRAQETIRRLEAANSALSETNRRLSDTNDRLNELVEQGLIREQGNKELARRIEQIVTNVEKRGTHKN